MRKKDHTESAQQLGNLLARYKRLLKPPQASVEHEVVEVVEELTSITLKDTWVSYTVSTRTVAILGPSVLRTELRPHHQAILDALKNRLGAEHAPKAII